MFKFCRDLCLVFVLVAIAPILAYAGVMTGMLHVANMPSNSDLLHVVQLVGASSILAIMMMAISCLFSE